MKSKTTPDQPVRLPLVGMAYRQARWGLQRLMPLLDDASAAAVAEQEAAMTALGRSPQEIFPAVLRNLFRMEEEGIEPFADPESALSVATRVTRSRLLTGTWEEAHQAVPIVDNSASEAFSPWARHADLHAPESVTVLRPDGARIEDSRADRSLDHQKPAPTVTMEGGIHWRGEA